MPAKASLPPAAKSGKTQRSGKARISQQRRLLADAALVLTPEEHQQIAALFAETERIHKAFCEQVRLFIAKYRPKSARQGAR